MNQSILFNDDLTFDEKEDAWRLTGQLSGQIISIFFHSIELKNLNIINTCTKYDLEEIAEMWLEENEIEGNVIHIQMK